MRILFTVCGRAGSEGLPGKNSGDFLGVPLVYYTLAAIDLYREGAPDVDCELALNTDDERLAALVEASGAPHVRVARDPALAGGEAPKVAVIASTLEQASGVLGAFDYVVDLDITSPLREAGDLARVVGKRASSRADVVFTVVRSRRNPCFNMVREGGDGFYRRAVPSGYTARQQAPSFYDMNASVYAYDPGFLASGAEIFEGTCDVVEMRDTAVLDLDEPGDLELMQAVARWLFEADGGYGAVARRAASYGKAEGGAR